MIYVCIFFMQKSCRRQLWRATKWTGWHTRGTACRDTPFTARRAAGGRVSIIALRATKLFISRANYSSFVLLVCCEDGQKIFNLAIRALLLQACLKTKEPVTLCLEQTLKFYWFLIFTFSFLSLIPSVSALRNVSDLRNITQVSLLCRLHIISPGYYISRENDVNLLSVLRAIQNV